MNQHDIRIRSWSNRPVIVCETCRKDPASTDPEFALLRGGATGIPWAEAVGAIEKHIGQAAFRVGHVEENPALAPEYAEQVTVGGDLVAKGPVDEYPSGYHPRTGQRLTPVCQIPDCGCSGEAHP